MPLPREYPFCTQAPTEGPDLPAGFIWVLGQLVGGCPGSSLSRRGMAKVPGLQGEGWDLTGLQAAQFSQQEERLPCRWLGGEGE